MRSIKSSLLLALLLLCGLSSAPEARAGGTLSPVSGSNNQTQINSALKSGGVVHLNAGTYTISDTIVLNSGNTLEGDSGAKIVLVNNANWPRYKNMIEGLSVSNVRITGFEVDGNRANNTTSDGTSTACGKYFYTMIYFKGSSNIEVDHMYLHHNWNDILKFSSSSNVSFHNNTVRQPGHDVVYAIGSTNVWTFDNYIRIYCNSGIRPDGTKNISIYNNDIARDDGAGGYAGIEVQGASTVHICNNNIHDTKGGSVVDLSSGAASISYSGCTAPPANLNHGGTTPGTGSNDSGGADSSGSGSSSGSGTTTTTTVKDSNGNTTTTVTDASGNATSTTTDASGKVVSTGTGKTTRDASGNTITTLTDSNGNTITNVTDANGNVTSTTTDASGTVIATGSGTSTTTGGSGSSSGSGTTGSATVGNSGYIWDTGSTGSINNNDYNDTPQYWDPSGAVTPSSNYSPEAEITPVDKVIEAIFGPLGESAPTASGTCNSVSGSAGLLPCGKTMDDPDTAWNECDKCDLCSMILMGQLSITFLIQVSAAAATIAIIFAGYLYVFAVGKQDLIMKSKKMIKYSLIGLCIIFLAWAIVDSLLSTLGYIDPMGGEWYTTC